MRLSGPRQTGNPVAVPPLTGCFIPWDGDRAVLLNMKDGGPTLYLPIFRDAATLRAVLRRGRVGFSGIKRIDDGPAFVESLVGSGVVLICDLRFTDEGRMRYTRISGLGLASPSGPGGV